MKTIKPGRFYKVKELDEDSGYKPKIQGGFVYVRSVGSDAVSFSMTETNSMKETAGIGVFTIPVRNLERMIE